MISAVIQPWGQAPTPLLPKAISQRLGHVFAPPSIREILGDNATLADLEHIWTYTHAVNKKCLSELIDIVKPYVTDIRPLAVYPHFPRSCSLESLPFSTRTGHAVKEYPERFTTDRLLFRDVLTVKNFGMRSAIEFSCIVESAIQNSFQSPISSVTDNRTQDNETLLISEFSSFLTTLSAWAKCEMHFAKLKEALPSASSTWPMEIQDLWARVGEFGTEELAGNLSDKYSVSSLIRRGLALLDDRMLEIAKFRILCTGPSWTLEELGQKYDISRERIRQVEKQVVSKLDRFRGEEFAPVQRRADQIRGKLGSAIPLNDEFHTKVLMEAVRDLDEENTTKDLAKALLFWLAGPYHLSEGWLLLDRDLKDTIFCELLDERNDRGLIPNEAVLKILANYEVFSMYQTAWLEHLGGFHEVEGGFIVLKGGILEKVETLLNYFDKPLSVEEMLVYVDSESAKSVRQRLIDDPRFWRINKQNEFVLAGRQGYDEYTGIVDEIVQELEARGGYAPFDELVDKLSRTYGVKESSVVAYLSTPMFIKDENGIVCVREEHQQIVVDVDITKASGCYQTRLGEWCWRVKVDQELLKGSGRLVPNAFAQQLGCYIGDRIDAPSECGPVSISWSLASVSGAAIGSLRKAVIEKSANVGDYLFLVASKPLMTFHYLSSLDLENAHSNLIKLALLLGKSAGNDSEALAEISHALNVEANSSDSLIHRCRQALVTKGEKDLAELMDQPKMSVDDYIEDMGRLFK